jgi:hypothetical protein
MFIWVYFGTQLADWTTIDSYSAIGYKFIGATTASDSRIGNNFIKAHLGHLAISSTVRLRG